MYSARRSFSGVYKKSHATTRFSSYRPSHGFTIVELLIVVVVIAILAAITIVSYNGIQSRAKNASIQTALSNAQKKIEAYKVLNGEYPKTQNSAITEGSATNQTVYADVNCQIPNTSSNVTKTNAWIPDIDVVLPQSDGTTGSRGQRGCFMYQSDGQKYILSAWNLVNSAPQNAVMYQRLGWRANNNASQFYLCNNTSVGGVATGSYIIGDDYYKYSYTLSNITDCNETPPSGA